MGHKILEKRLSSLNGKINNMYIKFLVERATTEGNMLFLYFCLSYLMKTNRGLYKLLLLYKFFCDRKLLIEYFILLNSLCD